MKTLENFDTVVPTALNINMALTCFTYFVWLFVEMADKCSQQSSQHSRHKSVSGHSGMWLAALLTLRCCCFYHVHIFFISGCWHVHPVHNCMHVLFLLHDIDVQAIIDILCCLCRLINNVVFAVMVTYNCNTL